MEPEGTSDDWPEAFGHDAANHCPCAVQPCLHCLIAQLEADAVSRVLMPSTSRSMNTRR